MKIKLKVGDILTANQGRINDVEYKITSFKAGKIHLQNTNYWVVPLCEVEYYVNGVLYRAENIVVSLQGDDADNYDPVNNPTHYTHGAIECIDAIREQLGKDGFIAFLRGTIAKYGWRLLHKDNPLQDAEKMGFYIKRLIVELKDIK